MNPAPVSLPQPPIATQAEAAAPWWRFPIMWLVVGGPASVIVACGITIACVLGHPDPVLNTREPTAAVHSKPQPSDAFALQAAQQARNHAATGEVPHGRP
jgi:hypothetical protein